MMETEYQRGYREGAEKMREDAARKASESCLAPPDGGSPTPDEVAVSDRAAASIRKLPITPPQPAAQVEDDEREMREAFETWLKGREDKYSPPSPYEVWKAALASRPVLSEEEAVELMFGDSTQEHFGKPPRKAAKAGSNPATRHQNWRMNMEGKFTRTKMVFPKGRIEWGVTDEKGSVSFWVCENQQYGGVEHHYRGNTKPEYMGENYKRMDCMLNGGECWHDGTSLWASEYWIPYILPRGDEAIFQRLEEAHLDIFNEEVTDDR